tara:strand:- start:52 stop:573 length:522 start_codon:yes stop_codon:yes gene_type:complete
MENNTIITKVCFRCEIKQPITEYYKHKSMSDGHLNKCKKCTKSDSIKRHYEKNKDSLWVDSERERSKEKYHRLNYLERSKELNKNKTWKTSNKYKGLHRKFKVMKGCEIHHWNYNDEYLEDFFILTTKVHRNWHRFITLDENNLIFLGNNGEVLDTKQKHENYINKYYPTKLL